MPAVQTFSCVRNVCTMASLFFVKLLINITLFNRIISAQHSLSFPEGFLIGAAGASYQIEGAWNVSDKSENVWDWFTHTFPSRIKDHSNGDVACDSYHRYKEDIALLSDINMTHYRLSISWSRVLPTGFPNKISKDGIQYYRNLLDELQKHNIEPFVTLYHWDHPEYLERMGGWTNDLMVEWFTDYANVIFTELGSKVKFFATINEPWVFCKRAYGGDEDAPAKNLTGVGNYICMHNVLKAHARTYHLYNEKFRQKQGGNITIVLPCQGQFAKYEDDAVAADIDFQFECGWMAHPIFSESGDYPEVMKIRIAENSKLQGYPRSRLPEFSKEWIEYIKKSADYFALNHYTSYMVESIPRKPGELWYMDSGVKESVNPIWPRGASKWLRVVPEGLRAILLKIKSEYNNPPVYITENGFSDHGTLADNGRIQYYYLYLKEMLRAMYEDGCDVRAFTAWSLLDNFEWLSGYTEKFGIVHIDFNDPNRTRTPKLSYHWWKNLIKTRKLQPSYEPPLTVSIK